MATGDGVARLALRAKSGFHDCPGTMIENVYVGGKGRRVWREGSSHIAQAETRTGRSTT
jgi:hypothetical protein